MSPNTMMILKANDYCRRTSRFIRAGLLLCLVFCSSSFSQSNSGASEIERARDEFYNGNNSNALVLVKIGLKKAEKAQNPLNYFNGLELQASSEISSRKYDEAEKTLADALKTVFQNKIGASKEALVYLHYAWLFRSQRKFSRSLDYSKRAIATAPGSNSFLAEYYLNIGRILFTSGFDMSAIIWLEKAEKLVESDKVSSVTIDTYRFLTLAWWSKLNYQLALRYAEKCASISQETQFKYQHRQALLDLETILSESGQETRAILILKKGFELSLEGKNSYQACKFATALLLHFLDIGDIAKASVYLRELEKLNADNLFTFEILLGKAVVAAYLNEKSQSEAFFVLSEKQENSEKFPLLYWRLVVAERNEDWNRFVEINKELLNLTTQENFRSGLPRIHLNFAKAYFRLNQPKTSEEYLRRSLALIEEIRKTENHDLSLGLSNNFHDAYRLLAQLKVDSQSESFALADFLKARLLQDRIHNTTAEYQSAISPIIRTALEELSLKYIADDTFANQIETNERLITNGVPELRIPSLDLSALDKISDLDDTALISYLFTLDRKLLAFVWEKDKPVRSIYLPVSEDEIESDASSCNSKINNSIFFKRDGKKIYDKLLRPLSLSAKHYVIIPDKSLWKIPFQALSPDGEKYLIEDKVISYAPSVSILLEQLKLPKPSRHTAKTFANSSYGGQFLQYVNDESTNVAALFNSRPVLDATTADFKRSADKFDILHFSMHAKVDNDFPLDSFLGFRAVGKNNGRLTVEDILNSKLKRGSLVFLASCDTNNVLSGEGLVSLAWGMMGAGATTVVSAQWEANDKLTGVFTKVFYRNYKNGYSSAEALQRASLEMIRDKSNNVHEPYYWANFTLNGDFR